MAISKGRQGREAQNVVRVYQANLRLKEVNTDNADHCIRTDPDKVSVKNSLIICKEGCSYAYVALHRGPSSETATAVGSGFASPAAQAGVIPMAEVFKLAVSSFKVHDWSLFAKILVTDHGKGDFDSPLWILRAEEQMDDQCQEYPLSI